MTDTADLPKDFPPASFETLIDLLAGQAAHTLGLIPGPDGKTQKQPQVARHLIDLLSVVEEKTRRNLTGHEHQYLAAALHSLQTAYLNVMKQEITGAHA